MYYYMAGVPLRAQDKSAQDYRLDAVHLAIALAHHQVLPTTCLLPRPCLASGCVGTSLELCQVQATGSLDARRAKRHATAWARV